MRRWYGGPAEGNLIVNDDLPAHPFRCWMRAHVSRNPTDWLNTGV